jgi:hypothetical protein
MAMLRDDELKEYIENFYDILKEILDNGDEKSYHDYVESGNLNEDLDNVHEDNIDEDTQKSTEKEDPHSTDTTENSENISADDTSDESGVATQKSKGKKNKSKVHPVKSSDITGVDTTYAVNYCENFYDKALKDADSENFLNDTISNRINGTDAPIDILNERVKDRLEDGMTNELRQKMAEMKSDIEQKANVV